MMWLQGPTWGINLDMVHHATIVDSKNMLHKRLGGKGTHSLVIWPQHARPALLYSGSSGECSKVLSLLMHKVARGFLLINTESLVKEALCSTSSEKKDQ